MSLILEGNIKIPMNIFYGSSINKLSRYFTRAVGSAITAKGRSLISMCAMIVESVLGEYRPHSFNAIYDLIRNTVDQKITYPDILLNAKDVKPNDILELWELE